ncbi:hypothetical protein [Azospirillum brasilense]|uniref:Uncharacterized protein n=1 Tax=Azospirillum brasilense TaxID=192 RepID=A0A235H3V8_AZOBR|nr:hypothetical protein [Azospirillum brasilense]OYD80114.1 hypothetical protein CHT98_32900 [Azospirillum brasilense]
MLTASELKDFPRQAQDATGVAQTAEQAMTAAGVPDHVAAGVFLQFAVMAALRTGSRTGAANLLRFVADAVETGTFTGPAGAKH